MKDEDIALQIAVKAISLYAETHPRPPHVTQEQAAPMLRCGISKVRKLIKSGVLRLNQCGQIPVTEIDRALSARVV